MLIGGVQNIVTKLFIKRQAFLWIIMSLAILLRIGAAFYLGDTLAGAQQQRAYDQISYDALAHSLLAGRGYSFERDWYPGFTKAGAPTAHWSFIYPLYLAGVYAIFSHHPLAARLLQVMLSGALSTILIYRIGRRLAGEQVGLVAAFLGAIYIYFIYYDATLLTEPFFILGVLATFELSLYVVGVTDENNEPITRRRLYVWILLGVVLGLSTLLRQTMLLWLPAWLAWIYWAGYQPKHRLDSLPWYGPLVSLGVVITFILPWTVRNYVVYDEFLPLNSNAGYALFSANHPNQGTQFDQDYVAPLPGDLQSQGLNEAQWNAALTQRGLQFIFSDPIRYLLLSLDRVPIFFNAGFSSESTLTSNLMRVLSFGLYLPFFLYGLVLSLREARRFALVYLFVLVFSMMHIFIWASVRYRLPVDAVLMPLAAIGILDLAHRLGIRLRIAEEVTSKSSLTPKLQ